MQQTMNNFVAVIMFFVNFNLYVLVANLLLEKWVDDFEDENSDLPFIAYFRSTWIDSVHFR